jgi:hypothetical protein
MILWVAPTGYEGAASALAVARLSPPLSLRVRILEWISGGSSATMRACDSI